MTTRTITLSRTVQVKQYEPLSFTIAGELDKDEDPGAAYAELLERMRAFFWEATGHQRIEFKPNDGPQPLGVWQDD